MKVLVLPPLTLWYNGLKGAYRRTSPKDLRGGSKMFTLSEQDFRAWKKLGKKVKFRPCFEVRQTVFNSTFGEVQKQWLIADNQLAMDKLGEARMVAKREARKHIQKDECHDGATGNYRVYAVVDGTIVETPTYVRGNIKVEDRVLELADEFYVSESVVWALYYQMPNELYDGIPSALEDIEYDSSYEDIFED